MTLTADLDAVRTDEGVRFQFEVTNDGATPAELQFRSSQRFDVVVTADGTERWRFADGMMFAQVLGNETLDPGETATYECTWDDPDPGHYEALATLEASNVDASARTTVTVD